jgi:hypothetical protein
MVFPQWRIGRFGVVPLVLPAPLSQRCRAWLRWLVMRRAASPRRVQHAAGDYAVALSDT